MNTRIVVMPLLALALATALCAGTVNQCATASLATYVTSNTTCEIDGLIFSGFTYGPNHFPAHPGPSATNITVTPITNPADPGFLFSSPDWTASGGSFGDSAITYFVQTVSGAATIGSAALSMTDNVNSEPFSAIIGETLCLGLETKPGSC